MIYAIKKEKPRRIVFLDIDGVLNSMSSAVVYKTASKFSPVSLGIVKELVTRVNADIVISSSWRVGRTVHELRSMFLKNDPHFPTSRIIDVTPRMPLEPRGREIQEWIRTNGPVTSYVILDDDGDMLPGQPFVQTNNAIGMCFHDYVRACKLFGIEP